jgi:hypothetical protein
MLNHPNAANFMVIFCKVRRTSVGSVLKGFKCTELHPYKPKGILDGKLLLPHFTGRANQNHKFVRLL